MTSLQRQPTRAPSDFAASTAEHEPASPLGGLGVAGLLGNAAMQQALPAVAPEEEEEQEREGGSWWGGLWGGVTGAASDLWEGAADTAAGAWDWTQDTASDAWDWTQDTASDAWDWTQDTASDAWDWTQDTASDLWDGALDWGTDRLIDGGSWLFDRYDDTWAPGLDWLRSGLDGATEGISDALGQGSDWLGDGLDWIGWNEGADKVREAGDWGNDRVEDLRDLFGMDETGNSFTHYMEIADDQEGFVQQYSELGLPIAPEAWAQQDAIDGGKLRRLYNESLLTHLQAQGRIEAGTLPEDLSSLDDEALSALASAATEGATGRALLDAMGAEERVAFQEGVLDAYLQMANEDEDAALLLDLMPTETDISPGLDEVKDIVGDALLKGQEPNDFTIGARTGLIRTGTATMAAELRAAEGVNTYGLVVPYANTVENVLFREGKPTDAAEHAHNYLNKLDDDTLSLLTGYSQGGGGVQEYLRRYGGEDGLDFAVSLAPMGGPTMDSSGGDGVWAGDWDGVATLTLANALDPAQHINGDNLSELAPGLLNFVAPDEEKELGGQSEIHSGFDEEDPAAGTFGYPMALGQLLLRDLFAGEYEGEYARRGDWDYDLRTLDPQTDWEALAAQYRQP